MAFFVTAFCVKDLLIDLVLMFLIDKLGRKPFIVYPTIIFILFATLITILIKPFMTYGQNSDVFQYLIGFSMIIVMICRLMSY